MMEMEFSRAHASFHPNAVLQQTRVATVISYWQSWTSRWPTIQALAAASPEDVLSAWKGLGYYSRATRIHQAAQAIVADPELRGLLPATAHDLEKKVAGVGRYTAGAISSIVFGRAEAILDGNVSRVLSRQLALYANPKSKATTDLLWDTAQRLVEGVAGFSKVTEKGESEVPGLWNQALMELGSTVCTPIPKCGECPIRSSCRAYAEGERLAVDKGLLGSADVINPLLASKPGEPPISDMEDLCAMCEPFSALDEQEEQEEQEVVEERKTTESVSTTANGKRKKGTLDMQMSAKKSTAQQSSLLSHFKKKENNPGHGDLVSRADSISEAELKSSSSSNLPSSSAPSQEALDVIQSHVKRFPLKIAKAQVREEKCIVCIIESRSSSKAVRYLLEQRPDKGLLASLWEFPTLTLADSSPDADAKDQPSVRARSASHSTQAADFVHTLLKSAQARRAQHLGRLGTLTHVFSHLKLEMNVHHFRMSENDDEEGIDAAIAGKAKRRWCTAEEVDGASIGTGMKRCWELLATSDTSVKMVGATLQGKSKKVKRK
jgi:A/G-specific adenine glycosylase